MRTRGSSVATLLLLVVYLATQVDSRTTKWNKSVPTAPRNENYDGQRNANGREIVPLVLDLQVDQSELLMLNMDDLKGVENIQDAMSVIGYEPQKVNTKKKRKIDIGSDPRVFNSHPTIAATPEIDLLYYEVPQIRKTIVTPQYPQKPTPELLQKQNTSDLAYIYPVPPARQTKQRSSSKLQYPIPQTPTPSENLKSKDPITPKPPIYRRPLSPESLRPRPAPAARATPAISEVPSSITRRKPRKRVEKAPIIPQEAAKINDAINYPVADTSRTRNAIHSEVERKARRPVAKQDTAPRSFTRPPPPRSSQEGGLEKLGDQGATLTRRGSNRSQWNAPKSGDPSSQSEVAEAAKSAGSLSNSRLYERKGRRQRPSVQVIRNDEPQVVESTKQPESFRVTTPVSHTTFKPVAREDVNDRPNQAGYSIDEATRTVSVTPAGIDDYQNGQTPVVSSAGFSSTLIPFTSLSTYYSNPGLYLVPTSTIASISDYEVSSASPWKTNLKERDVKDGREVDGVADATSFVDGDSIDRGSVNEGSGEVARKLGKNDGDDGSGESSHEARSGASSEESSSDGGEGDVGAESTHVSLHKDQRHQDAKGSAGYGGDVGHAASGGSREVESGGDEERSHGHVEEKGEEGKKGYKSRHEHEKANKGHHDKETKSNYFDEKQGKEKKHNAEGEYHQEHQHGEQGEKKAEYDEKGDHQKGYSTKGQHTVHKKDEFEKHTEFFDDYQEDGETEKDGEFHHDHEMEKGGSHKTSHHDMKEEEDAHGKKTKYEKGKEYDLKKGHKEAEGQDDYQSHKVIHGEKVSHEAKKSRSHSSGDAGESKGDHKSR
ncbi:uncharacterized protein LOC144468046 [Augochlora pura]